MSQVGPALTHSVYFSLADNSPEKVAELVAACKKYLDGHDGVSHFSVGTVNTSLNRPVNVLDYDVALNVVFVDRAAHDQYQVAPRHIQFIEESKPNWKQVRVFDSDNA